MASNLPSRKPCNGVNNNRTAQKAVKLDMPQLSRVHQQPSYMSKNNKEAKDAGKDHSKDKEKKLKTALLKGKQSAKRIPEGAESARSRQSGKTQHNERHLGIVRQQELEKQIKQIRKPKVDVTTTTTATTTTTGTSAVKTKDLRTTTAEANMHSRQRKESKSPVKDAAQRIVRNKNQSQTTKIFFDKYLKFAYDLSTPDGVRKLEAHFFPVDNNKAINCKTPSDAGDSVDKQSLADNKVKSKNSKHNVDHLLLQNQVS